MNIVRLAQTTDALSPMLGNLWALLDAERQNVRASILATSPRTEQPKVTRTDADGAHESGWQRLEMLQTRLGQLDRAMDRLIMGSYGLCAQC